MEIYKLDECMDIRVIRKMHPYTRHGNHRDGTGESGPAVYLWPPNLPGFRIELRGLQAALFTKD